MNHFAAGTRRASGSAKKTREAGAVTTPTGNGACAGDRRLTVAHLITADSSLRYLLYQQLHQAAVTWRLPA